MPRSARPWFRFYSEALENRKLQGLPSDLFKLYVNLLCLANRSTPRGVLPRTVDVAFALRTELQPTLDQLAELRRRGFLEGGWRDYRIHDWAEWQPDSDAQQTPGRQRRNADRTGKERVKNADRTPLERIDSEGEGDKEKEEEGEEERAPAYPFSLTYSRKHQERNAGRPCSPAEHAQCVALERDYGAEVCIEIAEAYDWEKGPAYLRKALPDWKEKRDAGRTVTTTGGPNTRGNAALEQPLSSYEYLAQQYPGYGQFDVLDAGRVGAGSSGDDNALSEGGLDLRRRSAEEEPALDQADNARAYEGTR